MKKLLLALVALSVAAPAIAQSSVYVKGYTKRDGTYVAPHYRSAPDTSRYNNYSTRGNVNPYTGKVGTVDPYSSYSTPTYRAPSYSTPTYSAPLYTPPKPPKVTCYWNCPD